ncbi:50S ribosomal protein L15 [Mariprofundus erugo]|uniref:Large ribosomal subunit protein uL15 n=1 Tax=Mariprofundus erugo TaxID=2528639 RepID=A0A5R9GEN4_9PROT|nr:50S ribosomal protein L15 [Mariprofundus erugo]TLS65536.1 50S ribosomal protein L15 [Mariprofundus erugo]TLS74058.1 50S ribosomal protein L15 [Mariprofundus erugo]
MKLNELKATDGSRKVRKRKGMGNGSGNGKTAGRGHKGQKSRTGGKVARGFEGGQMPLIRRVPKRGFTPLERNEFQVINLGQLNGFEDGAVVDAAALYDAGLVRNATDPIKLLARGELTSKVQVSVSAASDSAAAAVQAAGGSLKLISAEG